MAPGILFHIVENREHQEESDVQWKEEKKMSKLAIFSIPFPGGIFKWAEIAKKYHNFNIKAKQSSKKEDFFQSEFTSRTQT